MAREFGASKSLMGFVTLCGTVAEYPCYLHSQQLLRRYGPCRLLKVAHALMILRLVALSLVTPQSASIALPLLQLLHGPCFALAWTSAVEWASAASPRHLLATSQSVLSACYYVVGSGLGSVLWSSIYQHFGAQAAYVLGAGGVALSLTVLLTKLKRPGHDDDAPISLCRHAEESPPRLSPILATMRPTADRTAA